MKPSADSRRGWRATSASQAAFALLRRSWNSSTRRSRAVRNLCSYSWRRASAASSLTSDGSGCCDAPLTRGFSEPASDFWWRAFVRSAVASADFACRALSSAFRTCFSADSSWRSSRAMRSTNIARSNSSCCRACNGLWLFGSVIPAFPLWTVHALSRRPRHDRPYRDLGATCWSDSHTALIEPGLRLCATVRGATGAMTPGDFRLAALARLKGRGAESSIVAFAELAAWTGLRSRQKPETDAPVETFSAS